mmetsp:Transcript_9590/g.18002  ORF Transcript_9590/g.18002 Transcript_9590/m.18002 type:complete len:375 (+) Transcript_9590:156-1280(+)|eukprot:CAMPEP_0114428944 /NCGR_PEP_ID=MMETSP0103-20121206/9210_1 /TAXON_ID=37642 ORGANISM="Paraphysomonas imperforata, Strain PA2" /NCGR_SAMPLE_ID=MMETSP0103 /ASSEMBLY_ACC=CAM_ASM_000201 /LENGTH=374 /DNA_ID=CAMNT_0001598223 /DNA_START=138 /DNA_END=1262 /DNA_ORIENTATION=+
MGASASVYWEALNEQLAEEEVKMILGDDFKKEQFDSLKNQETGLLSRATLMELIHNHKLLAKEAEVKEIYHLFVHICPQGEMTRNNFTEFLREARLLSKKKFSKVEADIMFEKALKIPKIVSKTINFRDFMRIVVPLIAEKLKMEVSDVLHRLASVEQSITSNSGNSGPTRPEGELSREELAAMKIQTSSRRKTAVKHQKGIAEAHKSALAVGPEFFDIPADENHKDEKKLADVFATFCNPKTDMDLQTCLKLCKDSNIVNEQFFTNHDVQLVFLKTKTIANNNEAYKPCVICGKKLNYKAFREIMIPCLAEKRTSKPPSAESKAEIISLLCHVPSDNIAVETESSEALKSFFSILQHGAKVGEAGPMDKVLSS